MTRKYADVKKATPDEIFLMLVDDVTHSWYQGMTDKSDLHTKFGEEGDKVWDKKKSFQDLKQGSSTTPEFVRY